MGRIRSIKPEFPQSESIGKLSREARLLFLQLFTLVDDEGRTRAASRMLASLLYPYDEDAVGLIDGWLSELEQESHIRRYVSEGQAYLEIHNFNVHQKIDHPSKSKLPAPPKPLAKPRERSRKLAQDQGKDQGGDQGGPALVIPEWLKADVWEAWLEMRKKIRNAPFTAQARKGICEDLAKLHEWGIDPNARLLEGIKRGWRGVLFDSDKPTTTPKADPLAGMTFANRRPA